MRTTEDIIIKEHIKKENIYICDFCHMKRGVKVCCICEKDVCYGAYSGGSCIQYDPNDFSDYPDGYCPNCYELRYKKYEKQIDDIESKAIEKKEIIIQKIKEESIRIYETKQSKI